MAIVTFLRKIAGPNFLKRRRSKDVDPKPPGPPGLLWIPAHRIEAWWWTKLRKGLP
jgi:hypothetical protein